MGDNLEMLTGEERKRERKWHIELHTFMWNKLKLFMNSTHANETLLNTKVTV